MTRIMKLNQVLLASIALTMATSHAAPETRNPAEFDCRISVARHTSGAPKQGGRVKWVKVCPHKEKLAKGECEMVAGKGMRCLVSPTSTAANRGSFALRDGRS